MTSTTIVAHGGALDGWLAHRHAMGHDVHDEVWDGVYHVAPRAPAEHARLVMRLLLGLHSRATANGLEGLGEFNLGDDGDYRVPDFAFVQQGVALPLYVPTGVICGEVVSPGDASFEKIPFYLARGVQEVWLIEPDGERVSMTSRTDSAAAGSTVVEVSNDELRASLGWR